MALIQYLLFVKVFSNSISAFTRKAAAFAQRKIGRKNCRDLFIQILQFLFYSCPIDPCHCRTGC
jgi:hypothetical protein